MRCRAPDERWRAGAMWLLLGMAAAACGSGRAGVEIAEEEYGGQWPFTVERGELACAGGNAVVFTVDGTTYGVNEAALDAGYPAADPIRRASPIFSALMVSIAPVIEDGLALCR